MSTVDGMIKIADEATPGAPPRPRALRWLVIDLVILVVLGGAGAGVVAISHNGTTEVSSQSAVVVATSAAVTAPIAGTVTRAPARAGGRVLDGKTVFALAPARGGNVEDVPAPETGTVASVLTPPGSVVSAGETLAVLVPRNPMEVVAMVSEDDIRHVARGQSADITLPVDPGTVLHGHVLAIWPETAQTYIGASGVPAPPAQEFLKKTALVPVAISLKTSPPALASGESAEVTIHVGNG